MGKRFQHLLAPQSGALRISAYGDFQSHPIPTQPIHPLIAFEHLSLSMVIRNSASRPRQINVDQGRPKQVSILQVSKYPSVQVSQVSKYPSIQVSQVCKYTSIQVTQVCKYPKYASNQVSQGCKDQKCHKRQKCQKCQKYQKYSIADQGRL